MSNIPAYEPPPDYSQEDAQIHFEQAPLPEEQNGEYASEAQALGAFMHRPMLLSKTDLEPGDFVTPTLGAAFGALQEVDRSSIPADINTVVAHLLTQTGRDYYPIIVPAMQHCERENSAVAYGEIVKARAHQRRAMAIIDKMKADLPTNPEATSVGISALMALESGKNSYECSLAEAVGSALSRYSELEGGVSPGLPTGISKLDEITGGFQPGDLYVIGARPSVGKTALMLNMSLSAKVSCGIFSAEQPRGQIAARMLSIDGGVDATGLRNGTLDFENMAKLTISSGALRKLPIRMYDKPAPTITDLIRQARLWKHQNKIEILFVDYIQRIGGLDRRQSSIDRVGESAMALKELARTLDIPVVVLAQLNRQLESRDDKRPIMSDLKNSGEIEAEADNVMFLYRDEMYHPDTREPGIAEVILRKNRHGPIDTIKTSWAAWCMRFTDLAPGRNNYMN